MIEKILQYQKIDLDAIKIERDLALSEFKKNYTVMLDVLKDSKGHTASLENSAKMAVAEYEDLKKKYEENSKLIDKYSAIDVSTKNDSESAEIFDKIATISTNLNIIEKKILQVAERINNLLVDFEQTKKRYNSAKEKYSLNKDKYDEQEKSVQPKLQEIQATLKALEKDIEPAMLTKYKALRQDKQFLPFVPLDNSSCGGCRMELSTASITRIKNKGYGECEHCHRIIYIKK